MSSRSRVFRLALGVLLLSFAACRYSVPAVQGVEPVRSEDENPHVWQPQTRSVAVFKNGLGFFMREGNVRLRDGWCVAGQVPPAAFGTLAIYALNDQQAVDIVGSGPGEIVAFDDRDAPSDIASRRLDWRPVSV